LCVFTNTIPFLGRQAAFAEVEVAFEAWPFSETEKKTHERSAAFSQNAVVVEVLLCESLEAIVWLEAEI